MSQSINLSRFNGLSQLPWLHAANIALKGLGAISLLRISYQALGVCRTWLVPQRGISQYHSPGAWALVTGSSAGIGFACAQELASKRFNVILLGHKADELDEARQLILSEYPNVKVEILLIDCANATGSMVAEQVSKVSKLPIRVLVNNVGGVIAQPRPGIKPLIEYTPDEIDANINLNARFMTHMTCALLPVLSRNGPSLILNISSGAQLGIPGVSVYSAAKAFVTTLSKTVNRECKVLGAKVSVMSIVSGEVRTQANKSPGAKIDARPFGGVILHRAPGAAARGRMELSPFWIHALRLWVLTSLPEWLLLRMFVGNFQHKIDAMKKAEKQ